MKILVIHSPNMPLLGKVSATTGTRLTLDKINRTLRKKAVDLGVELKIYQFYDEKRIIKTISRSRNEISGILINPGPLSRTAFSLRELLTILKIPTVEVCLAEYPFAGENFAQSALKDVVQARFLETGAEPYLLGLNALLAAQ
ncbi:MAG: type II 3-dehydroquinate dehydratase [Candidatus Marinimicrobia bacterium]|nr:type II 3-dehydroquinate dehydratase [Candidatus Neomarinimicrobiota bacterium]